MRLAAIIFAAFLTLPAASQSFLDQQELEEILTRRPASLDAVPNDVFYEYAVIGAEGQNSVIARNHFYETTGEGNAGLGKKRSRLVEMLNRTLMYQIDAGDTLVVPTQFGLEMRAYSPFPRYYVGGLDFDKLYIMHKGIQAFAAYERGKLIRWGVINTGAKESPTPNGRYNFNWQTEYRVSSLSPPGEDWEMYWVFNIHDLRGIHVHQYQFPTGGPMSHGCVRLLDADARWLYDWADTWQTTSSYEGIASRRGRILEQGTTVLVIGDEPEGVPMPYIYMEDVPILKRIELPEHPFDVPPASDQQRVWDQRRLRVQARVVGR